MEIEGYPKDKPTKIPPRLLWTGIVIRNLAVALAGYLCEYLGPMEAR